MERATEPTWRRQTPSDRGSALQRRLLLARRERAYGGRAAPSGAIGAGTGNDLLGGGGHAGAGQERCPLLHERSPPLEQVRAPVGGLHPVPVHVGQRQLADFPRRLGGSAATLRLPNVGDLANEVVSGLGERWLDALARIEDPTAAGAVTGRRLHPPGGGFVAFPQGYIAPQARAGSDPRPRK